MQTRPNADKPTRDCVADSDKDPLKICKIIPWRLEHMHETVDIKILHPKNKTKQIIYEKNQLQFPQYPYPLFCSLLYP